MTGPFFTCNILQYLMLHNFSIYARLEVLDLLNCMIACFYPKKYISKKGIFWDSSKGAHRLYVVFMTLFVAHLPSCVRLFKILKLDE
jgi:hypothetical protein